MPVRLWKAPSLKQFKRFASVLKMEDDLSVRHQNNETSVIVSFPFLVEVIYKVHNKMAHLGRQKMIDLVKRQFWHPALEKVA